MMGSKSDLETMRPAAKVLEALGLAVEVRVLSAHRTPEEAAAFVKDAGRRGAKAFICGAGGAAHLAGAVAAHTTRPVIGVPIAAGTPGGLRFAAVDGADAAGHAGGHRRGRRRRERRACWPRRSSRSATPTLATRVEAERAARRKKVLDSDAEVRASANSRRADRRRHICSGHTPSTRRSSSPSRRCGAARSSPIRRRRSTGWASTRWTSWRWRACARSRGADEKAISVLVDGRDDAGPRLPRRCRRSRAGADGSATGRAR